MKRRNVDGTKLRRGVKRGKLSEGFCNNTLVYLKFLLVWAAVMMADFLLEVRFEYLWPFWLLMRSVYDSFRYQGLMFSVFFVCVAATSDIVCFLFIPVQWLFFLASTYVWVQYVWHAERGICLPTVCLWCLFIYVEASVRLRELRNMPFTLDLCRPFAAHCIGYPVVTLGFGVKSYVGYKFRLRKQKEVTTENGFYLQLLQDALPADAQLRLLESNGSAIDHSRPSWKSSEELVISNGSVSSLLVQSGHSLGPGAHSSGSGGSVHHRRVGHHSADHALPLGTERSLYPKSRHSPELNGFTGLHDVTAGADKSAAVTGWLGSLANVFREWFIFSSSSRTAGAAGDLDDSTADLDFVANPDWGEEDEDLDDRDVGLSKRSNSTASHHSQLVASATSHGLLGPTGKPPPSSSRAERKHRSHSSTAFQMLAGAELLHPSASGTTLSTKEVNDADSVGLRTEREKVQNKDVALSLESDIEKLRCDLRASRAMEDDLRGQIQQWVQGDKLSKTELQQLKQNNEQLQTKLHNLVRARQQDKQNIVNLEKKVNEEQKQRAAIEQQVQQERKQKKAEEAAAAKALAQANATKSECTEACKSRRRELENELKMVKRDLRAREDQIRQLETDVQALRTSKDAHADAEVLMSALTAMQEKNAHLENTLSSETRLKLDLFSALGDTKRQLEIVCNQLVKKDQECNELRRQLQAAYCVPSSGDGLATPPYASGSCSPLTPPPSDLSSGSQTSFMATGMLFDEGGFYTPRTTM